MSRRVVSLTVDNLADVSSGCRTCAYWSSPNGSDKHEWIADTLREWGSCGQILYVDSLAAGHVLYAPPAFVPRSAGFATSPVSPDAVLLMSGQLGTAFRGAGLGRMLIQGMARDAVQRGFKAIEAFGITNPGGTMHRSEPCLLPANFLEAVGFTVVRPHSSTPRLRLDIKTTLAWRADVELAIDRLFARRHAMPTGAH